MKDIFIATNTLDAHNTRRVEEALAEAGHEPVVYNADQVLQGSVNLSYLFTGDKLEPTVLYDGLEISDDTIKAAWSWRPNFFFPVPLEDKGKQVTLQREFSSIQKGILTEAISEDRWLNDPHRLTRANQKLTQLRLAKKLGFSVPDTVLGNNWDMLDTLPRPLVGKMSYGAYYENNESRVVFTTVLDEQRLSEVRHTTPFPAIFQPYLQKLREWRVTIVGDEVFPVAIYTEDSAKDDWRRPEHSNAVRYVHEAIDPAIAEKCILFLGHLGLRYGAFDFIESPQALTFLEMNGNGQFRGFEQKTGLHISEAIASQLIAIARTNRHQ